MAPLYGSDVSLMSAAYECACGWGAGEGSVRDCAQEQHGNKMSITAGIDFLATTLEMMRA